MKQRNLATTVKNITFSWKHILNYLVVSLTKHVSIRCARKFL